MALHAFAARVVVRRRISLAEIDAAVARQLGATRGLGKSQPACFNRQVAMYLAKYMGGWSATVIGRFYNGRDHSTVCHGIQRIKNLREISQELDALLRTLETKLQAPQPWVIDGPPAEREPSIKLDKLREDASLERLAERIALRVARLLHGADIFPQPAPVDENPSEPTVCRNLKQ